MATKYTDNVLQQACYAQDNGVLDSFCRGRGLNKSVTYTKLAQYKKRRNKRA